MIKIFSSFFCSVLFFFSCNNINNNVEEDLKIVAGTTKLTGSVTVPASMNKDSIMVTVFFGLPISGENVRQEIMADQSGKFSLDLDIETETLLFGLYTSIDPYKVLYLKSKNTDSTHIDISYNLNRDIKIVEIMPTMNKYDMMQSIGVLHKMIDYRPDDPNWKYPHLYRKTPAEFLNIAKRTASMRLAQFVDKDNLFSKEFKDLITKDYRLFLYTVDVFNYEKTMRNNYRNSTRDSIGTPKIKKIDRTYFSFLKDFKLNDPQYLLTSTFPELQDSIIRNEILGLPVIGDKDVATWLTEVKAILSDLVGFDEGPYYDILAANAYGVQLREEARPLSEKQKENITTYWKEGEIPKILFRNNNNVVEYDKFKSPTVVHDISSIPKERVMNEIISNYKNKVIFIDLWATWCVPCLDAMKQFRAAKGDFHDKDVAFVYITNGSSPKKLWEEKIKGIGHDHYYLTTDQWDYMMDHFELVYIPSYLLYNKEGKFINKFSSYPGNDEVRKMLVDLL